MTQILANAGTVALTKTWYLDGVATDVGDVTIGIVDGDGDVVVAAATATTNNADGTYSYTLADQPNPDQLVVTWTDVDSTDVRIDDIEVVGGWLFSIVTARKFAAKADATDAVVSLKSATEYPNDVIADERQRITDDLEYWTGRSWVPRYCRAEFRGSGSRALDLSKGRVRTSNGFMLHRPGRLSDIAEILSVTIGSTVEDIADFEPDGRHLIRTDGIFASSTSTNPFNVTVEWVYGLPHTVDGVDRVALKLLVDRLVPSAFPDRMITADTQYGTVRYVQPGGPMNNVTRIPEVNDWVNRHDHRIFLG